MQQMEQARLINQVVATLWSIWCHRNDVLFRKEATNPVVILKLIEFNSKRGGWKFKELDASPSKPHIAIKQQVPARWVRGAISKPISMKSHSNL